MIDITSLNISFWAVLPELIVLATAVSALACDMLVKNVQRINVTLTASLGLLIAFFATRNLVEPTGDAYFGGMIVRDSLSILLNQVFIIGALLAALISHDYARRDPRQYPEFMALLLFSTLGMMVISASADLITLFVGIELLSLSLFVLAGSDKDRHASGESALKYFLLGAFSTGFLVYGMAFIFGVARTTNLTAIGMSLAAGGEATPLLVLGFALLLVGLGFKISLVPFHMWAPDVYQGAPAPVTAWIATGSKIAGFVALLRVFIWPNMSFAPLAEYWVDGVWWLALLTMIVGNAGALVQTDIKRMLAYSSIAHGGYLSMAFTAHNQIGAEALLFYLAAYLFMTLGAFGVVIMASRRGIDCESIGDLAGLSRQRPFLAGVMSIFMLSLAGMPGTAGFVGKLWLFGAAIQAEFYVLALVGVLTTLLSFYYYLRVIVTMYVTEPGEDAYFNRYSISNGLALSVCAVALITLGVYPDLLWHSIRSCWGAS